MSAETYRHEIEEGVPFEEVAQSLALAVLGAECLLGESRVRLEAEFSIDEQERCCTVNAGTESGRQIARLFTGFLVKQFGEEGFWVQDVSGSGKSDVGEVNTWVE